MGERGDVWCHGGCAQQGDGREDVCVGGVFNVREIEEVGVVTELEACLGAFVSAVEAGDGLDVAFAEEDGGTDGAGEDWGAGVVVGAGLAVGGEDEAFCDAFGFGVEFALGGGTEDGVCFVGVDEGGEGVVDDGGGGGVDEGFDGWGCGGAGEEVAGSVDVYFFVEVRRGVEVDGWGGGVDDDLGFHRVENGGYGGFGGDVAGVVGYTFKAISCRL